MRARAASRSVNSIDDATADESAEAEDGRRLRWTAHRATRRAAFVSAGAAAIDRHGPLASAEQIAAVARVSRTVLYRYFRDREDLRQAIADEIVGAVIDSVVPNLELGPETTPRQVITAAVGSVIGWLDDHPNLYHFLRSRRTGSSLDSVEHTLADQIARLLRTVMTQIGIDAEQAEPGAYGIVGFVESAGAWWLTNRTMSRERFTDVVCTGVWHLLQGSARDHGVVVEYDEPLPIAALLGDAQAAAAADATGAPT